MSISSQTVKELRDKTGAGMMECKKALVETNGNVEGAINFLRERGILKAQKKAERTVSEGRIFTAVSKTSSSILTLNCETDFVSSNDDFIAFGNDLVQLLNDDAGIQSELSEDQSIKGTSLSDRLAEVVLKVGESVKVTAFKKFHDFGDASSYIHSNGKIGVLLLFEKAIDSVVAKDIAMHVAAMNPQYLSREDIDSDYIENEKSILLAQALKEGKPAEIAEKMVIGRLNKSLAEMCLLDQVFVKDSSKKVKELLVDNKILEMNRVQLG